MEHNIVIDIKDGKARFVVQARKIDEFLIVKKTKWRTSYNTSREKFQDSMDALFAS